MNHFVLIKIFNEKIEKNTFINIQIRICYHSLSVKIEYRKYLIAIWNFRHIAKQSLFVRFIVLYALFKIQDVFLKVIFLRLFFRHLPKPLFLVFMYYFISKGSDFWLFIRLTYTSPSFSGDDFDIGQVILK